MELTVRILTLLALAGLLGAVGLRLTWREVTIAYRQCSLPVLLIFNFVLVPVLAIGAIWIFKVPQEAAIGLMLLAVSPFAPVVPVFARMGRADLALAAVLSSIFLVLTAILAPLICAVLLPIAAGTKQLPFLVAKSFPILLATLVVPLGTGLWVHHKIPDVARRLVKPVELAAEMMGALSLAFVTVAEFGAIRETGWRSLAATGLVSELAFATGYLGGGNWPGARRVLALGASNRNIALALVLALDSFAGTKVVAAVVANGLLLILLGLVHVGFWRLWDRTHDRSS